MMARHDRGQSLVEFSLVIPIFLVLLVAVFDLGRGVFAYTSVTNAAREGARFATVNQDTDLIKQRVLEQTFIAEALADNIDVQFTGADCPNLHCMADVTYSTRFEPITPLIASIVFPTGIELEARSVMALEYICPNSTVTSATSCPKQP